MCSICLDMFNEPVSTPCGHNYCKNCIKTFWGMSEVSKCPLCKEIFRGVPELRVNTEFRDMLEVFKKSFAECEASSSSIGLQEVPCDLCHGTKEKAVKSCLVCLASYCSGHLEPHCTVPAFKWHKLINPVSTLEDRVCRKHNKIIEFFCREDHRCVCIVCLRDDHVKHNAVPLEEEIQDRKTKLECMKKKVKHALSEKCMMVSRIQNSVMQGHQEVEKMKAETIKAFNALVASIETRKIKLIELLEERHKAACQKAEAFFQQLQLEIAENNETNSKLEELLSTEDDFRLLQSLPSCPPSNTELCFTAKVPLLNFETVRSAMAKIEEILNEEMDNIIIEVGLEDKEDTFVEEIRTQTGNVFNDELWQIQKHFAVNVSLDSNTAHPCLILSGDRKKVWDGGRRRKVPDNPTRFDFYHFVLGKKGFSSGRFYYEVMLKGKPEWEIGVVRESITKKGCDLSLSPENGCWTLGSYWGRCQANANPPVILSLSEVPEKIGVFVDYELGLLSFYDLNKRALIYSFTKCAFTAKVPNQRKLSAPNVFTGTPTMTRIYPLFRPSGGMGSGPLAISPLGFKKGKF